jgi:hypothetical protein
VDALKYLVAGLLLCLRLSAATHYIDSIATGTHDGSSWTNAWPAISSSYSYSGGPTGTGQTYNIGGTYGQFSDYLPGGTAGNRVTYQIGQDSAHNGTATFNNTTGGNNLIFEVSYLVISGDAGDGQMHFACTNYGSVALESGATDFTLNYFSAGSEDGVFTTANPGTGMHMSHCYHYVPSTSTINIDNYWSGITGSAYTDNTIDHCTFYTPYLADEFGPLAIEIDGNGWTISNNTVVGYLAPSSNSPHHHDAFQSQGCSHGLIYNNRFINMVNYACFLDGTYGPFVDIHIYNNFIAQTDNTYVGGSQAAIVVGVDGGFMGTPPCTFNNVTITNNTVVDFVEGNPSIQMGNVTGTAASFTNCQIANNATVNYQSGQGFIGVGNATPGGNSCTPTNNVWITAAAAPSNFVSYTSYAGLGNNLALISGASTLIYQGSNSLLDSADDILGNPWHNPPSIGAYEYGGITAIPLRAFFQFPLYRSP